MLVKPIIISVFLATLSVFCILNHSPPEVTRVAYILIPRDKMYSLLDLKMHNKQIHKIPNYPKIPKKVAAKPKPPQVQLDNSEVQLLARLIASEAESEPFYGQVAVGATVINRTKSSKFPKTIKQVISQPGQFQVVSNGRIWRVVVTPQHLKASRWALLGVDPTHGALYFHRPSRTSRGSRWLWQHTRYRTTIKNHEFRS